MISSRPQSDVELLAKLDELFEALIGPAYGMPGHPARLYTDSLRVPGPLTVTPGWESSIAQALLDVSTWGRWPADVLWEKIGPAKVKTRIQSRLADPSKSFKQYFETLAELRTWGQIRAVSGLTPVFSVSDDEPDLHLTDNGVRLWIEVKFVHNESTAIKPHVKKANKQIRDATGQNGAGTVVVNIGGARPWTPRIHLGKRIAVEALNRLFQPDQYRSVSQLVITWDDYVSVVGDAGTYAIAPRRRATSVYHPAPRTEARIPDEYLTITPVGSLVYAHAASYDTKRTEQVVPVPDLAEKLAQVGLSWLEVSCALSGDPVIERYEIGTAEVALTMSPIHIRGRAVWMLTGGLLDGNRLQVRFAYPLPPGLGVGSPTETLTVTPLRALLALADHYQLPQYVGDQLAPLVFAADTEDGEPDNLRIRTRVDSAATPRIVGHLGSRETTLVVLHHVLDQTQYLDDLRRIGVDV